MLGTPSAAGLYKILNFEFQFKPFKELEMAPPRLDIELEWQVELMSLQFHINCSEINFLYCKSNNRRIYFLIEDSFIQIHGI